MMLASPTIEIKEFDGGRTLELQRAADLVFIETGDHCYTFDAKLLLHAVKRLYGISVILEHDGGHPLFALP
jgi:hypothetical protein